MRAYIFFATIKESRAGNLHEDGIRVGVERMIQDWLGDKYSRWIDMNTGKSRKVKLVCVCVCWWAGGESSTYS